MACHILWACLFPHAALCTQQNPSWFQQGYLCSVYSATCGIWCFTIGVCLLSLFSSNIHYSITVMQEPQATESKWLSFPPVKAFIVSQTETESLKNITSGLTCSLFCPGLQGKILSCHCGFQTLEGLFVLKSHKW